MMKPDSFEQVGRLTRLGETVHRAFAEFLKVPILVVAGFLLLAAGTTFLDRSGMAWLHPLRAALREYFFRDGPATSDLLATIAGSIITVTSITFSLLLLAVQQAASALTHQVYDQFLRRRVNQIYFGFFVGLAIYTLIILATVDRPYNPVFGATLALLLTLVALMLIILLLYTTINQMRPIVVIETIHDHALGARASQRDWLIKTHATVRGNSPVQSLVQATKHGYVVRIDIDALAAAKARIEVEIVLRVSVGANVAFHDTLAEIRADSTDGVAELADAVRNAVRIEQQRDLETDAAYGIEQLATIGWTSISTAKSNPSPGILVIHSLGDLLARWSAERLKKNAGIPAQEKIYVVYADDVLPRLLNAFESLAVVASESMQPQTMAEIVRTFANLLDRLPSDLQDRAEDLLMRILSALGEHVLTAELSVALSDLARELDETGRREAAHKMRTAHAALAASIGKLGSRATRVAASASGAASSDMREGESSRGAESGSEDAR